MAKDTTADVSQEILNVVSQQLVLLQQIQQLLQNAPVQQIVQQQQAQTSLLSQLSVGLTPFGGQNVS